MSAGSLMRRWSQRAELAASVATVIGLFVIYIELDHNTNATRSAGYQSYVSSVAASSEFMLRPELAPIFSKGRDNLGALSDNDLYIFDEMMYRSFNDFESGYYMFSLGTISPRLWSGWCNWIKDEYIGRHPGIRAWWQTNRDFYSRDFAFHIDAESCPER